MIIGKFQQDSGAYTGTIPTLTGMLPVRIGPTDQKGVDYVVTVHETEYGVAWKKTSAKGNEYLSLKLDTVALPVPVNCALIKQADGYALLWDREKPKSEAEAA